MPYKRRASKARDEPQITPQAIELFRRGKKFIERGQEDWLNEVSFALAGELRLRPWMTCPLDCIGYSKPGEWEDTQAERDDWLRSSELRSLLEIALRDRRRAQRRAAKGGPPPRDPLRPP